MEVQTQKLYNESVFLLRKLSTANGILASTIESNNNKRIWARDTIICGIAGLLAEDNLVIESQRASLLTLSNP